MRWERSSLGMRAEKIGRLGENIVCELEGFVRQPASGAKDRSESLKRAWAEGRHGWSMSAGANAERKRKISQAMSELREKQGARIRGAKTMREYLLKWHYGITVEEYNRLEEEHKNRCGLCGKPRMMRRLCVDHDHDTNIVRGLLCNTCNRLIGWYEKRQVEVAAWLARGRPIQ